MSSGFVWETRFLFRRRGERGALQLAVLIRSLAGPHDSLGVLDVQVVKLSQS